MKSAMTLHLDTNVLLKLIARLATRGGTQDVSEAVSSAIELWLGEQAKLSAGSDPASVRGYQWKSVFLPEGTVLRSWSYGEHNYARVEGDQIIHDGKPVSPNQFAQLFARSTRNAWTDLYVRRPCDQRFMLACRLRQQVAGQGAGQVAGQVAPGATPAADAVRDRPGHGARSVAGRAASHSARPALQAAAQEAGALIPETTVLAMMAAIQAQAQACQLTAPSGSHAGPPAGPHGWPGDAARECPPNDSRDPRDAGPHAAPPRDPTPGAGWTLPERRKMRFRLEDVAFD